MSNVFKLQKDASGKFTRQPIVIVEAKNAQPFDAFSADDDPAVVLIPCKSTQALSCPVPDDKSDYSRMSATELRKRYPREASSHKAMLQRRSEGAEIHPALKSFRAFLTVLGPMPARSATVDRIDHDDLEYAPGKIRWADKVTQTRNRRNTVLIASATGQARTATQVAARLGKSPDTIRKQRSRGWTDAEITAGHRSTPASIPAPEVAPVEPVKPSGQPQEDNRSRGRWIALHYQQNPTEEEIFMIEQFLERRRTPLSPQRRRYDELAIQMRSAREEHGVEDLPATQAEDDIFADCSPEIFNARWAKIWVDYRPHVKYANLNHHQLDLIRKIDPEYIDEQEALIARKNKLLGDL